MGCLLYLEDDWERRIIVVEALRGFDTPACARLFLDELRRVRGDNRTRRYLRAILDAMSTLSPKHVVPGLEELLADKVLGPRISTRAQELLYRLEMGEDLW